MRHAWVSRVRMVALVGVLVLAGNPYTAHAGKPVPPPAPAVPRVVDANNKLVGQVIGTYSTPRNVSLSPTVILNISIPSIVVTVTPTSFRGNQPLFFTAATCTGQPYFDAFSIAGASLFPVVGVVNDNVYIPRPSAPPSTVTYVSQWVPNDNSCYAVGGTFELVIADFLIDLSTQFQQPYTFVYP